MRYSKVIYYAPLALAVGAALAYLALYLLNVFYSPPEAGANTAPPGTYHLKEVGDDEIWNWDFNSNSTSSTNVDWALRFVSGENAEIDKVKDRIDGEGGDPTISPALDSSGSGKKAWVDDGTQQTGSSWDSDAGKKEGNHCGYGVCLIDRWGS